MSCYPYFHFLYSSFVFHTPWKQQYILYNVSYLFCLAVACLCASYTNTFNNCQMCCISASPVLFPQETLPVAFFSSLSCFYFSLLFFLWKVSLGFTTTCFQITFLFYILKQPLPASPDLSNKEALIATFWIWQAEGLSGWHFTHKTCSHQRQQAGNRAASVVCTPAWRWAELCHRNAFLT